MAKMCIEETASQNNAAQARSSCESNFSAFTSARLAYIPSTTGDSNHPSSCSFACIRYSGTLSKEHVCSQAYSALYHPVINIPHCFHVQAHRIDHQGRDEYMQQGGNNEDGVAPEDAEAEEVWFFLSNHTATQS